MDADGFDRLAKSLSGATDRRRILTGLVAGVGVLLLRGHVTSAEANKPDGTKCNKDAHCASGHCCRAAGDRHGVCAACCGDADCIQVAAGICVQDDAGVAACACDPTVEVPIPAAACDAPDPCTNPLECVHGGGGGAGKVSVGHSSLCCNQAFNNCRKTPTGPDPGTFETVCLPQPV